MLPRLFREESFAAARFEEWEVPSPPAPALANRRRRALCPSVSSSDSTLGALRLWGTSFSGGHSRSLEAVEEERFGDFVRCPRSESEPECGRDEVFRLLGGEAGAELRLLDVSLVRALPGWSLSCNRFFFGTEAPSEVSAVIDLSPLSLFSVVEPSFLSAACLREGGARSECPAADADVPLGLSLSSCLITLRLRGFDGDPSLDKTIVSASELPSVPPSSSCLLSRDEDNAVLASRVDVGEAVLAAELLDRSLADEDAVAEVAEGLEEDFASLVDGGAARDKVGDLLTEAAEAEVDF